MHQKRKKKSLLLWGGSVCLIALPSLLSVSASTPGVSEVHQVATSVVNPLMQKWTGPHGGVPPLDKVKVADFKPALEGAMQENLAEIDKLTANPSPATFENTIVELERSGKMLDRVQTIYGIWSSTMSTKDFQAVEEEMEPRLAAFYDKIVQNEKLFKRIEAVYTDAAAMKALTPEQQRLTWNYYTNFARAGAKLDTAAKARLSQLNQELASLYTKFSQNQLHDESEVKMTLKSKEDLAGLPQSLIDAAAANAKEPGVWVIRNTRSSVEPFLTYSSRRDLRESAWRMFVSRGDNAGEWNNDSIITRILQLRLERARLLGYATHAHWRLENSMAKTPDRAIELMEKVWPMAVERVKEEVADMKALAEKEGNNIIIEPWDYRYYAEKVRKAKYDLDQDEVKQYCQLEKLREGMFWVAGELFDLEFLPVADLPVNHPDVRVWQVKQKSNGKDVGLWYFDPYAREGKRSGAWMNAYRNQQRVDGEVLTIVSNNSNFVKGQPGEPVLISWDDANTLFHEFGHALHGLCSNVTYPSLSGTNVVRDYVEFPSQLLEHWFSTPQVMTKYALHYKTGDPIPASLVAKIEKAATFNQGFSTTEYLSSALVDMKIHLSQDAAINPREFESVTLQKLGMPREIVMRHRLPHFGHIFSSDGYSAGYYSYLWADVITADAFESFLEGGGPYDKNVSAKLKKEIFSVGNTIDPADAYRKFRGRDAKIDGLLRDRGFPLPAGSK